MTNEQLMTRAYSELARDQAECSNDAESAQTDEVQHSRHACRTCTTDALGRPVDDKSVEETGVAESD